jgi:hypothetical protein
MAKRTYRFSIYKIHGHLGEGTPDYREIARKIVSLSGQIHRDGSRVVAIGTTMLVSGVDSTQRAWFVAYSGDVDRNVLFFDLNRFTETSSLLESGRFVARKTRALFDPVLRTLVIESGRGHLPPEELAKIIEEALRDDPAYASLEVSFAPVAAPSFITKIETLERIQSVSVSIARPNVDWSERYDQLAELADDSRAGAIETTVRARRSDGLSKSRGIVPNLKRWLSAAMSSVSSARIKGALPGQSSLIELRLRDHVDTFSVTTEVNSESGQPADPEMQSKLGAYMDQRAETEEA